MTQPAVTKASGEVQPFDRAKFCQSLHRANIPGALADEVCSEVEKSIRNGMSTSELYKKAWQLLLHANPVYAARYALKKGIMELGPAGFIFEKYLAAILKEYGYGVKLNQIMKGACISHEIDVIARRKEIHYFVEAKYHNIGGVMTDIHTVMYVYARLLDIQEECAKKEKISAPHKAWIITNTRFTDKAIAFGKCRGLKLTGWSYPPEESLQKLIENRAIYPVTVLPAVDQHARQQFARNEIVLVRELLNFTRQDFENLGIRREKAEEITEQAGALVK